MWQQCPVCKGSGKEDTRSTGLANDGIHHCHVCKGAGIISEITGLPPAEVVAKISPANETTITTGGLQNEKTLIAKLFEKCTGAPMRGINDLTPGNNPFKGWADNYKYDHLYRKPVLRGCPSKGSPCYCNGICREIIGYEN